MSFVSPNIFDFVARKNDERYVHEKILVQLFNDKKYKDILLDKFCHLKGWKIVEVIEQPMTSGRESKSGSGFADILLLAENCKRELLPIILELKTNTDTSNSQLADYYYNIKNTKKYCSSGYSPNCFYITPDKSDPAENSLERKDKTKKKLEKGKEFKTASYREVMSYIEIPETKEINFDFILKQYKLLVNEAQFCGITSVKNIESNFDILKNLCHSVYEALKKKTSNRDVVISSNTNEKATDYYHVDIAYKGISCLRFEIGCSSLDRKEDKNKLRILYGARKEGTKYTWATANYAQYLKNLNENRKMVYYNENEEIPSDYLPFLTQGGQENHLNPSVWLFAQNLLWIAADIVNNVDQIQNTSVKIADFILDDLSMIH